MTKRQLGPPLALVTVTLADPQLHRALRRMIDVPLVVDRRKRRIRRDLRWLPRERCDGRYRAVAAGSGSAAQVETIVASGRGVMPAGLVKGQEAADVAAYVASLAS
jgi:hypothetical protein